MNTFKRAGALVALVAATSFFSVQLMQTGQPAAWAAPAAPAAEPRPEMVQEGAQKADQLSALFRKVASSTMPAVVVVEVRQKVTGMGPGMGQNQDMEEFFRRFFGEEMPGGQMPQIPQPRQPQPQPRQPREFFQRGIGSGVIVDAANGYILTNAHVVAQADQVTVTTPDGKKLTTDWVRSDPQTDLAVIKVKPNGKLASVEIGNSDQMQIGDWVLAIGAPEGLDQTVTAGIISAKGRTTGRGGYENFLQTDAAINHGNSGGPLVNMRGEIIGINTAIISRTGASAGIGLAIPSNMARSIMRQLIDKGEVTRGYLGVVIQDVDDDLAESFKLPGTRGALVSQVAGDSPAAKAGMQAGDFITQVAERDVESVNALRNAVAAIDPGKKVAFTLYRDGTKKTIQVTIGEQPAEMASRFGPAPQLSAPQTLDKLGLRVATASADLLRQYGYQADARGVVITDVTPGSNAAEKGLRAGMMILKVDGQEVTSASQFVKAVGDASRGVRLLISDAEGGQRFVFLKAGD